MITSATSLVKLTSSFAVTNALDFTLVVLAALTGLTNVSLSSAFLTTTYSMTQAYGSSSDPQYMSSVLMSRCTTPNKLTVVMKSSVAATLCCYLCDIFGESSDSQDSDS